MGCKKGEVVSKLIKQRKTMEKWNLSKLKKEFWRIFSIYVRMKGTGVCFSCGKIIPDYYDRYGNLLPGWKAAHAGHFITAKSCGLALYFHEQNVHSQCYHCNINLSGNWVEYERKIIEVYGQDVCDKLKELKWSGDVKYSKVDYMDKIEEYADKIIGLSMTEGE